MAYGFGAARGRQGAPAAASPVYIKPSIPDLRCCRDFTILDGLQRSFGAIKEGSHCQRFRFSSLAQARRPSRVAKKNTAPATLRQRSRSTASRGPAHGRWVRPHGAAAANMPQRERRL